MYYSETRTKEGGSVASFIIIGLVLVGLVAGGLYAVNQRGERSPAPTPIASNTPTEAPSTPSPAGPVTESPAPATQSNKPTAPSAPNPSQPAPSGKAAPLPETGPEEYMPGGIVLALLVASTLGYVRSLRELKTAVSTVD